MPFLRTNVRHFQPRRGIAGYVAAVRGMGQCFDPESGEAIDCGGAISMPPVDTVPITGITLPGSSTSGLPGGAAIPGSATAPSTNLASILQSLASGSAVGAQIYKSLQTPSLVPGTNAIYNPATGTYYNPATGQVVAPSGLTTGSAISAAGLPILLVGGLLVGGVVLISALGGRH